MEPVQQPRSEPDCAPDEASPSDRELLERFIERRDERAFEILVRLHGPLVLGVCRRIIGHHHDAEEAFQATFLVLARKAASVQPPDMVANWLNGVACRTALKMRSTVAQRRAKEFQVAVVPEPKVPQSDRWEEIAPLLDRELSRLPDKYRAAVVCCDLEGRSRHDAAQELGWPEGTLKVRLMQARAILAKRLARQGIVLSVGALAAVVSENAASAAVSSTLVASTAKAAGALAAIQAVPTAVVGAKGVALTKGMLKSVFLGKAAVATTAAGVAVAATLFVISAQKPISPQQTSELKLPAEVQRALEENARQLSPITVTCTSRIESRLSPVETFVRLQMNGAARPDRLFEEYACRVIWQDQQFYTSKRFHAGEIGDRKTMGVSEITFDGRVFAVGSIYEVPKEAAAIAQALVAQPGQNEKANGAPLGGRLFNKEPVAKALELQLGGLCGLGGINPYFCTEMGLVFQLDSHGIFSGGRVVEQKLRADSAILDSSARGGRLISVTNMPFEGKQCVRIELEVQNPVRRIAEAVDLEKERQNLKMSRETPKRQAELVQDIEDMRMLPAMRRYVYYLDPELHYAVRRCEQRYGPDTLLSRTDCSQFEQIPGRRLWLPRRVESQLHEYPTAPGIVFKDAFLTQILAVSAFDGSRVPDETFKLDYTAAGTIVRDGTDPATAKTKDGFINYTVPARPEDLAGVIERARNGENMAQFGGGTPPAAEPPVESHRKGALLAIVVCNVGMFGVGYLAWRRRREGIA
jgi:RNA polymerase sigma factor (sigma-70 family)